MTGSDAQAKSMMLMVAGLMLVVLGIATTLLEVPLWLSVIPIALGLAVLLAVVLRLQAERQGGTGGDGAGR